MVAYPKLSSGHPIKMVGMDCEMNWRPAFLPYEEAKKVEIPSAPFRTYKDSATIALGLREEEEEEEEERKR